MQINGCLNNCEDIDCQNECVAAAAENSLRLLERLQDCVQASQCPDIECIRGECPREYDACREDSSGIGTCPDVSDCFFGCRANAEECQTDCFYAGSVPAQDTFGELIDCMGAEGCMTPANCAACAAEDRACDDDGGG